MAHSSIATAADYAEALLAARRAKNWLVLLLILVLLGQLAIFFALWHWPSLIAQTSSPDPQPAAYRLLAGLKYLVAITDFLGIALTLVLSMVLLLITGIMLVGRLIGVGRLTSAYIWCLVLVVFLFPWQSFLSNPRLQGQFPPEAVLSTAATKPASQPTAPSAAKPDAGTPNQDFKIPGVLYTWGELTHPFYGATFHSDDWRQITLHWARYVAFPVLALIILLSLQVRSSRGLKMALGEGEAEIDFASSPPTA